MDQAEVVAMQDRFLDDMEAILGETASAGGKLIVMLSGGSDSFLIIAVLRHLLPDAPLHTVTIGGDDTRDADGADAGAAHFRTPHTVRRGAGGENVGHFQLLGGTRCHGAGEGVSPVCYPPP